MTRPGSGVSTGAITMAEGYDSKEKLAVTRQVQCRITEQKEQAWQRLGR